jgi:prepilin-type N-terminal cleavage/methylation domain-containing protein
MYAKSDALRQHHARQGFTLIELLIVIAIIGILLQITLPAVEMSREAARRTQCSNNLRQVALGFQSHHDTQQFLPSSGWGWRWTGHPDRGFGEDQPGGWAYNLLPYIEQGSVRELGVGMKDGTPEKAEALLRANASPIAVMNCPSRRRPTLYPVAKSNGGAAGGSFSPILPVACQEGDGKNCLVARGDFAVNSGSINQLPGADSGPLTLDEAKDYDWTFSGPKAVRQNGVSYQRSKVRLAQILDGLSKTYAVGERFIELGQYASGTWDGDDQSLFVGHDGDSNRYTGSDESPIPPLRDVKLYEYLQFGSAHPNGLNMALCDGAVIFVAYGRNDETSSGLEIGAP